jgi:glycerol-3-phosphate O-acyltransferase/dihydroxyacetone phosphate acyltransferase
MTAKATLFGQRNFSSWLIENVGSVPIKRSIDNPGGGGDNDNTLVINSLIQVSDY